MCPPGGKPPKSDSPAPGRAGKAAAGRKEPPREKPDLWTRTRSQPNQPPSRRPGDRRGSFHRRVHRRGAPRRRFLRRLGRHRPGRPPLEVRFRREHRRTPGPRHRVRHPGVPLGRPRNGAGLRPGAPGGGGTRRPLLRHPRARRAGEPHPPHPAQLGQLGERQGRPPDPSPADFPRPPGTVVPARRPQLPRHPEPPEADLLRPGFGTTTGTGNGTHTSTTTPPGTTS